MSVENRIKEKEEAKKRYYELESMCWRFRDQLHSIKKHRGHSDEFKMLDMALKQFEDKVSSDYKRFELRIKRKEEYQEVKQMQQALNRERKLRHDAEARMKEAATSGGLFIEYVKTMLGMKND